MGISSGTFTGCPFVHYVQIELEIRNDGFWGEEKTGVPGEKPLWARMRTNNKLNPHLRPRLGIEAGPHWWEASVFTTAPSLFPCLLLSTFCHKRNVPWTPRGSYYWVIISAGKQTLINFGDCFKTQCNNLKAIAFSLIFFEVAIHFHPSHPPKHTSRHYTIIF